MTRRRSINLASPRARGITLGELLLMLAILGVLAAIANPRYASSLALYRVQAAAGRIAADVNLARWRAKAGSLGQTIVFDVAANKYQLPGVTALSGQTGTYAVALQSDPYASTLVSASFASTATLSFDRYGRPAAGGTVVVRSGGISRSVVVDAVTGQASVQ